MSRDASAKKLRNGPNAGQPASKTSQKTIVTTPLSPKSHSSAHPGPPSGAEPADGTPHLAVIVPAKTATTVIHPDPPPWITVGNESIPAGSEYVYAPDNPDSCLRPHALANALLSLSSLDLDFVIVSSSLQDLPAIAIHSVRNNTIFSRWAFRELRAHGQLPFGARGRVLRVVPGPEDAWLIELSDANQLEIGRMQIRGADLQVSEDRSGYGRLRQLWKRPPDFIRREDSRPRVLVLPVFMAVGGAERNLLQMMKVLKERFAFVVATTEPVSQERGSLNHDAIHYCETLFDLGEVAPPSEHMRLLELLKEAFHPDLVLLANGSPWLVDHAERIRELFSEIPIVDQQVYDAREGWIQHFDKPGVLSSDRFIAINREIAKAFEDRWKIDPQFVDLIYHAVDTGRFNLKRRAEVEKIEPESRFDFAAPISEASRSAAPEHVFGQVARLTPQKRPKDFLEIARQNAEAGRNDLFLLIGDGELAGACDKFIDQYDLQNVKRIPFHDDMSELYPVLSGLIFTSAYEGLPVALLEALCMGVPVLSTAVGDIRPILDEFGGGLTVEAGAGMAELFDAFNVWRNDLPWLHERAKSASPRIVAEFDATRTGERYAQSWETAWKQVAPHTESEAK